MSLSGAIVPHAPVLLPQLASADLRRASRELGDALAGLDLGEPEVVVVASPHGRSTGVYKKVAGSLDELGVRGAKASRTAHAQAAVELAAHWNRPRLDGPADHGVVVPLMAGLAPHVAVVAVSLEDVVCSDGSGLDPVIPDARALADAVVAVSTRWRAAFVASAHTAAALSPRAPLMERREARAVESRLLRALRCDAGAVTGIVADLWAKGRACGVGPLETFSRLFAGNAATIVSYMRPLGIGYLVAVSQKL